MAQEIDETQTDLFGAAGDKLEKPDKKGGPKKGKVHPAVRAGEGAAPPVLPHRPYEIIKEGKYIAWLLNL